MNNQYGSRRASEGISELSLACNNKGFSSHKSSSYSQSNPFSTKQKQINNDKQKLKTKIFDYEPEVFQKNDVTPINVSHQISSDDEFENDRHRFQNKREKESKSVKKLKFSQNLPSHYQPTLNSEKYITNTKITNGHQYMQQPNTNRHEMFVSSLKSNPKKNPTKSSQIPATGTKLVHINLGCTLEFITKDEKSNLFVLLNQPTGEIVWCSESDLRVKC